MTAKSIEKELSARDSEARRVATKRIAQLKAREAVPLLLRALGDEDWRVRKEAALAAPEIEPRAPVVDALVGALHDAVNVGLRNAAVEALVGIGQDAIPRVVEELARLDADGKKLAVEVLGGLPDPRGARALAQCLADPDPNVRSTAAEALGRAGASGDEARELATEALSSVLGSGETFLVLAALESLARLEARVPWSVLAPLARHPVQRRAALAAAAPSNEPAAIAALAEATGDASATIAREATTHLGDRLLEIDDEETIERARAALRLDDEALARLRAWAEIDAEPRVRGGALEVLGLARREEDVPRLVDALADDTVAERAEAALHLFGHEVVGPLIVAGRTAAPLARGASISIVPTLVPTAAGNVVPQLREALASPQIDVTIGALKALGMVGDAEDLAAIVGLARHREPRVGNAALSAIFAIAARHSDAAATARAKLDASGPDAAAGCVLVDALARMGKAPSEQDLAFLKTSLAQGNVLARRAALEALATMGGEQAAQAAAFALADEEREVVLAAIRAVGRLKKPEPLEHLAASSRDPVLIAAVLRALDDADPERFLETALPLVKSENAAIACAAVEALGRAEGTARDDGLFAALDHPDTEVVKLALTEVGRAPDARALARLGMCLDHAVPDVRSLAGELLGQAGGPGAQALLRARLVRERDPAVRAALTEALMTRSHAEPAED